MAKYLQFFVLFIFVSSITYGQQVSFGVKSGLNYSYQIWHNHPDVYPIAGVRAIESRSVTKPNIGIKLGVFAEVGISKYFSFTPGVVYNEKGLNAELIFYNSDQVPQFSATSNKVNLKYLSLDAPVKFKLERKQWISYMLVGTRIDALLSYKQSADKEVLALAYGYKVIYEQLNNVNVGLLTAIGVERKFKSGINGFLELEYNLARASNTPWRTINNATFAMNSGIRWKMN